MIFIRNILKQIGCHARAKKTSYTLAYAVLGRMNAQNNAQMETVDNLYRAYSAATSIE